MEKQQPSELSQEEFDESIDELTKSLNQLAAFQEVAKAAKASQKTMELVGQQIKDHGRYDHIKPHKLKRAKDRKRKRKNGGKR